MSAEFTPIIHEVEFLITERREFLASGPTFKIVLRSRTVGTVVAVSLLLRGREFPLELSTCAKEILCYLAQHRNLPQTAAEIEIGLRDGTHALKRRTIKVIVQRLRLALQSVFKDADFRFDPRTILTSQKTETNIFDYRLRAKVLWEHI